MVITDILAKTIFFNRKKVFRIALGNGKGTGVSRAVYVKVVTDEGIYGLGEASPFSLVTGETIESVLVMVEHLKPVLIGANPCDIADIHNRMEKRLINNCATKAAIDIACYDILGKVKGVPVHKLLGAKEDTLQTDMTVGIGTIEEMVEDALTYVSQGFEVLKVKLGIEPEKDIQAIKAIRQAVGDKIELRVDANQGYDVETALHVLNEISKYNVVEAEQPIKYCDIDGMVELNAKSPITIMADESICSPEDAERVCKANACEIVNIKLMKCGGIYKALQISDIAKKYGKTCIVGCMGESILGISAGAAVVLAKDNIVAADLDAFYNFTNPEVGVTGGCKVEKDKITMSNKPGFGFDEYEFK